jgi:sulfopyruvate decarboxylase TPP-binding subunit
VTAREDAIAPKHDLSFGQSGATWDDEVIRSLYDGIVEAGVDMAIFLPDSMLDGVEQMLLARGEIETYQCVREDEGVAIASGAYMVGRRPAVFMEGLGVGMSATILVRCVLQRTPMLMIASHSSTLGERYDYHAPARLVTEPVLRALNIPYQVAQHAGEVKTLVVEGHHTVRGQKTPLAILLPPHVMRAPKGSP